MGVLLYAVGIAVAAVVPLLALALFLVVAAFYALTSQGTRSPT